LPRHWRRCFDFPKFISDRSLTSTWVRFDTRDRARQPERHSGPLPVGSHGIRCHGTFHPSPAHLECRIIATLPVVARASPPDRPKDDHPDVRAMVIVVRNRKVNRTLQSRAKACAAGTSEILPATARLARLHPVHRDT
jgi:hypothetical protein